MFILCLNGISIHWRSKHLEGVVLLPLLITFRYTELPLVFHQPRDLLMCTTNGTVSLLSCVAGFRVTLRVCGECSQSRPLLWGGADGFHRSCRTARMAEATAGCWCLCKWRERFSFQSTTWTLFVDVKLMNDCRCLCLFKPAPYPAVCVCLQPI